MNNGSTKFTLEDIQRCEKLVAELRKRAMKPKEILQFLNIKDDNLGRGKMMRYIVFIGRDYPVYQPCPYQYAILSDKRLEEADEMKRAALRYSKLDREYKRNDK